MKRVVAVLEEDILLGRRNDPHYCPIARATERVFVRKGIEVDRVDVGSADIAVLYRKHELTASLPKEAKEFVKRFDAKRIVLPFVFTTNFRPRPLK